MNAVLYNVSYFKNIYLISINLCKKSLENTLNFILNHVVLFTKFRPIVLSLKEAMGATDI